MPSRPEESQPDPPEIRRIYASPEFAELRRRRRRLAWPLTTATMAIYIGFFVVVALAPGALGAHVDGFGSVGLLVVVILFATAFVFVWAYLSVSGRDLAPRRRRAELDSTALASTGGEQAS